MTENIVFFYTEDMVLGDLFKKNIQIFLKSAGCLLRTPALLKIISLFTLRICEEHTTSLLCGEIHSVPFCHCAFAEYENCPVQFMIRDNLVTMIDIYGGYGHYGTWSLYAQTQHSIHLSARWSSDATKLADMHTSCIVVLFVLLNLDCEACLKTRKKHICQSDSQKS